MPVSILLYFLALVFAVVACMVPTRWAERALAAGMVLIVVANLIALGQLRAA